MSCRPYSIGNATVIKYCATGSKTVAELEVRYKNFDGL